MTTEHEDRSARPESADNMVRVQVIYAGTDGVWRKTLELPFGSRVMDALQASRFAQRFPDCPKEPVVGVYGQVCEHDRLLADGERVEIYRKLSFDPMESRRRRAVHRQAFTSKPKNRPKRRKAKLAEQHRESQ